MQESLCWTCRHAYADRCLQTPFPDRAWIHAVAIRIGKGSSGKLYPIYTVLACSRYQAGRRETGSLEVVADAAG